MEFLRQTGKLSSIEKICGLLVFRWRVVEYYRVPKMSYYFLKNSQTRFLLSFAYQDELESQSSGTQLRIPVWIVNDYPHPETTTVHCKIQDLSGDVVWQKDFTEVVPADGKKEMGIAEWVAPDTTGIYVLTGHAIATEGGLETSNRSFIKVTPKLFARPLNVLLIGQRKYSLPIAATIRAVGVNVDVMDEESLAQFAGLTDGQELRKKYDVIWLASFDSIWRLLTAGEVEGLKTAIASGAGFIHTGGRGSFHGGFGEGATLDFTGLDEILPVKLQDRYDLVLGPPEQRPATPTQFSPIKNIQPTADAGTGWSDSGLKDTGLPGFNATELKPDAHEILSIDGRPLFVTGQYGHGRTVAFTGFTPEIDDSTEWVVDQKLYEHPINKAYLQMFMQLLVAATGEKPQTPYETILAKREEPLFEVLKNLPPAKLTTPAVVDGEISLGRGRFSVQLTNNDRYARLIRIQAKWNGESSDAPYLVLYSDNYFDLLPGETKTITGELSLPDVKAKSISGALTIRGVNLPAIDVPVRLQ